MTEETPAAEVAESVDHATLAQALVAAQAAMPPVEPDQENPHFKSKFVGLGHLLSKVRPVLNAHGLVLIQAPTLDGEGRFVLRTTIMHSSGEKLEFAAPLTPTKNDPQGQGSAITYMRRYSLSAALAIADQEDDDGHASAQAPVTATDAPQVARLTEECERIRAAVQVLDPDALPEQSFTAGLNEHSYSVAKMEEFRAKLAKLQADVERFEELAVTAEQRLEPADFTALLGRAERRGSRSERVSVLEEGLAAYEAQSAGEKALGEGDGE